MAKDKELNMLKKIGLLVLIVSFSINMHGCTLLLGGAAGGAGTAAWLSGKSIQEVDASLGRALKAVKSALKSLRLNIVKETIKESVAQVMSNYTDGKTIWVDVHRISDSVSRIEVRVGVTGNKEAEQKILKRITRYL